MPSPLYRDALDDDPVMNTDIDRHFKFDVYLLSFRDLPASCVRLPLIVGRIRAAVALGCAERRSEIDP